MDSERGHDHECRCLYSAHDRSNVGFGDDHSDLDGRWNEIRHGEHRDNGSADRYVSERVVQSDHPAGRTDDPDQPVLCHSEGNGEL